MDDVDLAHHLATVAGSAAAPYLERRPEASSKSDGSPVTEADLAVEAALLRELAAHRPDDDVLSEESGSRSAGPVPSPRRWVLDPMDGTEAFVAGGPSWGTHIALQLGGTTVLGVITRPTEGRRWWAVLGQGAWSARDGDPSSRERVQVSDAADLASARVGGFAIETSALAQAVSRLARWATDPLSPVLALAEGRLDAVVATGGQVWDHAPQVLLVTEAGGTFADPAGGRRIDRGGGVYSNGRIVTAALTRVAWPT